MWSDEQRFIQQQEEQSPSQTVGNQAIGNCIGQDNECEEASVLFSITTADAQAILILIAASFSIVKCTLTAVGNYSYFHLALSFLTVVATVLAFIIFRQNDWQADFDAQIEAGYGDDIILYKLAFVCALILGCVNAVLTYQTQVTFRRVQAELSFVVGEQDHQGGNEIMREICVTVRNTYLQMLLFGLVFGGALLPLIAFGKADWNVQNFGPANFDQDNAKLLMSAMILGTLAQGLVALALFLTWLPIPTSHVLLSFLVSWMVSFSPILATAGILFTALARVNSAREAGGFAYLLLIFAVQAMEFYAEAFRCSQWLHAEHVRNMCKPSDESLPPQYTSEEEV